MSDHETRRLEHIGKMHLLSLEASGRTMSELVRMLFLFNGGALIAILALLGALARNGQSFPPGIDGIIRTFGYGLASIVAAALLAWWATDTQSTRQEGAVLGRVMDNDTDILTVAYYYRSVFAALAMVGMIASLVFGMAGMTKSADALGDLAERTAAAAEVHPRPS